MPEYKTMQIFSENGLTELDSPLEKNDLVLVNEHIRGFVLAVEPLEIVALDESSWEEAKKRYLEESKEKSQQTVDPSLIMKVGLRGLGIGMLSFGRRRRHRNSIERVAKSLASIMGRGRKRTRYH